MNVPLAVVSICCLLFGLWRWVVWNLRVERRLDQNEHDIQSIREWLDENVPVRDGADGEPTRVNMTIILERAKKGLATKP